jgi:hypothetical protein
MRKSLLVMFLLSARFISAQGNLVPNGGFEINAGCPSASSQIYLATGWSSPSGATPDYYHSCATVAAYSVPNNWEGEQTPHDGSAYSGLIDFTWQGREYIQIQLTDTLSAGQSYCVGFFVSLAGRSDYATMGPQMYISDSAIATTGLQAMTVSPQILNTTLIYDTVSWIQIFGEYIAQGGERYITIGRFFDNNNTQIDTIGNHNNYVAYFYIDDVYVIQKVNSEAGLDKILCQGDSIMIGTASLFDSLIYYWQPTTGLSDSVIKNPSAKPDSTTTYYLAISDPNGLYCLGSVIDSVTITVNDCTPPPEFFIQTIYRGDELFYVSALEENTRLEMYDVRGRRILLIENYRNDFSVANLAPGVYICVLSLPDETTYREKILVVK